MDEKDFSLKDLEAAFISGGPMAPDSLSFYTPRCDHVNITSTFTGIGYVILDVNGVVYSALDRYKLDRKELPTRIILEHFRYVVSNLLEHSLKDIHCFFEYVGDPWIDAIISVLKASDDLEKITQTGLRNYTEFEESVLDVRIAIVLSSYYRTSLNEYCSRRGMYVGVLETMMFVTPFAHSNVIRPYDKISGDIKYEKYNLINNQSKPSGCSSAVVDYLHDRGFTISSLNEAFLDSSLVCKSSNSLVDENFAKALVSYNSVEGNVPVLFDGRVFSGKTSGDSDCQISSEETSWDLYNVEVGMPWSGKDLDLVMSPVIDKISMKHLANIQRSAKSMHDGKFQYSTVVRESKEPPKKISPKMAKMMQENEARIRKEKEKHDNAWLRGFYGNYMKLPSLKAKRDYIENIRVEGEYINSKLSLLKIELYMDVWNLEKRSEAVDERVLVPLYLNCLDFIERAVGSGRAEPSEIEFALSKLVEAGFEATAHELIEKHQLKEVKLDFKTKATSKPNDVDLYFQLKYAGEHLKRTLGTTKDRRVPFDPDRWQVQLLDAVDAGKSAVVAAPTSSGKTFICFYAIEKILRSSDTDVVVFCLPTKALVNQVSADVYARFTPKSCKTMLQGTLMNDKSNDPFNCQVLITVPAMLESLLASRDCSNIKYIIIDEVHKINDESLGLKLERIIHLSKAPLLLLSATIGNLDAFYGWFKGIETRKGRECELVTHSERFCELKTHVYKDTGDLVPLNCMLAYSHSHLKQFGFGDDLNFLPEELLNIYYYIYMVLDADKKKMIKSLAPKNFFKSNVICKADIKQYERHLLTTFEAWVKDGVLSERQVAEVHSLIVGESLSSFPTDLSEEYIARNILRLLMTLKDKDMLPVIVFNTDREVCTRLARAVFAELERQDATKRKDRALEKAKKEAKRNRDVEKTKDSWIEDSIMSEQVVEPDTRDIKYTFLDPITKLTDYEVKEELSDIKSLPKDILDMAYRGIGIHHSAMSRKYRSAVEILFRKKHVRVLFATETLALGINMPCRTVVFAGDSLHLDPMNYKQMSGRAGRRGYDTLGNIVFMGIPLPRVQNLLVSNLPQIQGGYIFSNTTFVSFRIEDSVVRSPLIGSSRPQGPTSAPDGIASAVQGLSISHSANDASRYVFDALSTEDRRMRLLALQKDVYKFIYPSNYLWDVIVSNRESDPAVFVFSLLLCTDSIVWDAHDFINTIAHIFEVRPFCPDPTICLPPLPKKTRVFLEALNESYKSILVRLYSPQLRALQAASGQPMHYINSFLYCIDAPKNSYILDFYNHGSPVKVMNVNLVGQGQLWQSLYNIDQLMKSVMQLLETYHGPTDERLKKLKLIHAMFDSKFKSMFA